MAALVILATVPAAAGGNGGNAATGSSAPTLLVPSAGESLVAGSDVTLRWDAQLPACSRGLLGEQEVYLSLDGGRTFPYRVTPRLAYDARTWVWRIPNLPAEQAVVDLRFGCEEQPGGCELGGGIMDGINPQWENRFSIASSRLDYVGAAQVSAAKTSHPGDTVGIRWDARVRNLDHYEVLSSVDRGGQFEVAGSTRATSMTWTLPEQAGCVYVFKVAAVLADGSRIESVVDMTQLVYVTTR